jgi:high-affinity iron transporter
MFANYLIGLREGLEAALVVGILLAYVTRTGRHDARRSIWIGVIGAASVSLAVGALLTFGPKGLSFEAQELIGGSLSIIAVGFVTWMILWMASAAKSVKSTVESKAEVALASAGSLALVAALAVGREGLETALFVWAATRAVGSTSQPLVGAALGLGTAVVVGIALHAGAVRLNLKRLFTWSGYGLVIVAAGVLAYGIHDLQEARFLPGLNTLAFDVSDQVPPSSWYGTLLKGTINFSPATTVLEAVAWVSYVLIVGVFFTRRLRSSSLLPNRPLPNVAA